MTEAATAGHYPVLLDLRGRLAVIVGGTPAAERKARSLARHGADVVVIAREVSDSLLAGEAEGLLTVENRGYVRGDLNGALVVLVFEGSEEVRRAVFAEAEERGTLVNVAGSPELTTFIIPSVVRRGDLQIAVSTGGVSPETTRQVRASIAKQYGPEWEPYTRTMAELRSLLAHRFPDDPERRDAVLARAAASDLRQWIAHGERPTAMQLIDEFDTAPAADPGTGTEDGGA